MCSVAMKGGPSSQSAATTVTWKDSAARVGEEVAICIFSLCSCFYKDGEDSPRHLGTHIVRRNSHCLSKTQLEAVLQNVLRHI